MTEGFMGRKVLNETALRAAAAMTRAGASAREAAEEIGVRRDTLYRALRKAGIEWKRGVGAAGKKHTPGRAKELERLLGEGRTLKSACAQVGIAISTAYRWEGKGWITLNVRNRQRGWVGEEKYRRIYERYKADEGITVEELGKIYGVEYKTLLCGWRRLGLELNPERVRAARAQGGKSSKCEISDGQLRKAWEKYSARGSYASSAQIKKEMGLSWERIKREWARMGYDVEGVVRHKYDREHGRGTYNAMIRGRQAARESGGTGSARRGTAAS